MCYSYLISAYNCYIQSIFYLLIVICIFCINCLQISKYKPPICANFYRYTCECIQGFTGAHCETDINECASNPCANGGVCIDLVNGFRCECPRGYYDARCLSDVDECKSNPCKHGGSCEDGVNQFICHCLPGKMRNKRNR